MAAREQVRGGRYAAGIGQRLIVIGTYGEIDEVGVIVIAIDRAIGADLKSVVGRSLVAVVCFVPHRDLCAGVYVPVLSELGLGRGTRNHRQDDKPTGAEDQEPLHRASAFSLGL